MKETDFQDFERLITARTGLHLRPREREALRRTLATRIATLHLKSADAYHRLLQAGTRDAANEWEQLAAHLTNNESYFFRDKRQMALLRERILPELISRNRARRTLRLWSAGCSTGEEAYSLAILVDALLPQRGTASGGNWEIVILGTDIDGPALQQARRGIYSPWSFRTVEPELQERYFHRREGGLQVAEASRSLVTFGLCNLVGDPFPGAALGLHDMDLILCRNVFIYFDPGSVSAVLRKFARTLRDGGYLMTGHTETYGQSMEPLQARMFPESVIYQRVSTASVGIGKPTDSGLTPAMVAVGRTGVRSPNPAVQAPNSPSLAEQRVVSTAAASVRASERGLAVGKARHIPIETPSKPAAPPSPPEPPGDRALLLQARTHADLGHYEEAIDCCELLIKEVPFASEPYELLASIAQEQRRYEDARLLLKKALYLAPTSPAAYLELAALYRSEGDLVRTRKMHVTALELLRQMPPDAAVGFSGGPTAGDWILHLKRLSAEGE